MKKFAYPIALFALILMAGGIFAFIKAHSLASLYTSISFGLALLVCAHFVKKETIQALYFSAGCLLALHFFFLYRFCKSLKLMPAGLMVLLTTLLAAPIFSYLTKRIKESVSN